MSRAEIPLGIAACVITALNHSCVRLPHGFLNRVGVFLLSLRLSDLEKRIVIRNPMNLVQKFGGRQPQHLNCLLQLRCQHHALALLEFQIIRHIPDPE